MCHSTYMNFHFWWTLLRENKKKVWLCHLLRRKRNTYLLQSVFILSLTVLKTYIYIDWLIDWLFWFNYLFSGYLKAQWYQQMRLTLKELSLIKLFLVIFKYSKQLILIYLRLLPLSPHSYSSFDGMFSTVLFRWAHSNAFQREASSYFPNGSMFSRKLPENKVGSCTKNINTVCLQHV
jgi:hypothetical protein